MSTKNDDVALSMPIQAVKLYCCYAEKNKRDWDELNANLAVLARQGMIEIQHNHDVLAGGKTSEECHSHLDAAKIGLLLISHYFFSSDLCWELMSHAMTRHDAGTLRVVPILLSPVYYPNIPIHRLETLPEGKPIRQWSDRQAAYVDVVQGIYQVIRVLRKEWEGG